MKKIILLSSTLLFLPILNTSNVSQITSHEIYSSDAKIEEISIPETITEDYALPTTSETENNMSWTFNLDPLIDSISNDFDSDYITSIYFPEQEINFRYSIEWKENGTISIPDYNWYYFYTNEGPGDANGHTGYNEQDLDNHVGGVTAQETLLEFGHSAKIASGYSVTYYDEYLDDGYGWEDNGSGYHWEPYEVWFSFLADDSKGIDYALKIDWTWTTEMPYTVKWDKVNQVSEGVLDTIGNMNVEINLLV